MTPTKSEIEAMVERLLAEGCKNGGQGSYAWKARELCTKAAAMLAALAEERETSLRKTQTTPPEQEQ